MIPAVYWNLGACVMSFLMPAFIFGIESSFKKNSVIKKMFVWFEGKHACHLCITIAFWMARRDAAVHFGHATSHQYDEQDLMGPIR